MVALVLPCAETRAQTRIVAKDAGVERRAQSVIDRSLLPSPPVAVDLTVTRDTGVLCGVEAHGCASGTSSIVMRGPRRGRPLSSIILLHELGHVAANYLPAEAYRHFESLLVPGPRDRYFARLNDETWAEAWAFCATRWRYPRTMADVAPYFFGYGFYPTAKQLRATCRLLAREASAAGWSPARSPHAW